MRSSGLLWAVSHVTQTLELFSNRCTGRTGEHSSDIPMPFQVLGYYNRRGINPEAFLREIKFIATDPEEHFFSVTDESALKDIVDALGEKIFSLEGMNFVKSVNTCST